MLEIVEKNGKDMTSVRPKIDEYSESGVGEPTQRANYGYSASRYWYVSRSSCRSCFSFLRGLNHAEIAMWRYQGI